MTAVRDAAIRLARVSDEDFRAVVEMLEAGTVLHRRIALHVLAVVPSGAELVAERIANRDIFDEYRLKHEYAELLRSRLGEAPPKVQRTFLGWVLAGPDLDGFSTASRSTVRLRSEPRGRGRLRRLLEARLAEHRRRPPLRQRCGAVPRTRGQTWRGRTPGLPDLE